MLWRVVALLISAIIASGCFLNVSSYRDSDGSTLYVGEVYNGGRPLSNPSVEGRFYDAAGNLIGTHEGAVCQVLPEKGIAAFEVRLPAGTPDAARVEWALRGDEVDNVYLASGLQAEITNTIVGPDGTSFVFGQMRNTSASTYLGGYVCAAWVDASGKILRVDLFGSVGGIDNSPGTVMPFKVQQAVPAEAVGVNFYLDAGVSPPPNPPFAFKDLPASAFENARPQLSLPLPRGTLLSRQGEVRNDGTRPIFPTIVATVNDASGKLAGVSDSFDTCDVAAPPGGTTFRSYSILTPVTAPGAPSVRIEASEVPAGANFVTLEPTNARFVEGSDFIHEITGTVRNTSSETLDFVEVCAGAYDEDGMVIGYGSAFPELPAGGLAPNALVQFTVELVVSGTVDEVKAVADGSYE